MARPVTRRVQPLLVSGVTVCPPRVVVVSPALTSVTWTVALPGSCAAGTTRTMVPAVPPELAAIVLKALQREPDVRYQDARSMQLELTKFMFNAFPNFSVNLNRPTQNNLQRFLSYLSSSSYTCLRSSFLLHLYVPNMLKEQDLD